MAEAEQAALLEFSRGVGDTLSAMLALYPQVHDDAVDLTAAGPSPSAESVLIELRRIAGEMVDSLAITSRTIDLMAEAYSSEAIPAQHHPGLVRPLLLDLLESCALLARVPSLGELGELPLVDPEELQARADSPQVAAWLAHNHSAPETLSWREDLEDLYEAQQAAAQPAPPPAQPAAPPVSPYPSAEPADPLPAPAAPFVEPPPPATPPPAPADPWRTPPLPGQIPGERTRGQ